MVWQIDAKTIFLKWKQQIIVYVTQFKGFTSSVPIKQISKSGIIHFDEIIKEFDFIKSMDGLVLIFDLVGAIVGFMHHI